MCDFNNEEGLVINQGFYTSLLDFSIKSTQTGWSKTA